MAFDAAAHHTEQFNRWVSDAQSELATLDNYSSPFARGSVLRMASTSIKAALYYANKLGCSARKALCLRVLNWLRADLRRLPV